MQTIDNAFDEQTLQRRKVSAGVVRQSCSPAEVLLLPTQSEKRARSCPESSAHGAATAESQSQGESQSIAYTSLSSFEASTDSIHLFSSLVQTTQPMSLKRPTSLISALVPPTL